MTYLEDIQAIVENYVSSQTDPLNDEIETLKARIAELESTPEPEPDPEPVLTNPQARVISDAAVEVSWTAVPGATGYLVGRDAAGGESSEWSTTDPAGTSSRQFRYLKPNTTYTFSVQALPNGSVETVQAKTQTATTPPADPDPDPQPEQPQDEVPGLPILGIGINGDAGPQDDAHLRNLRALTPGSMWYRQGIGYTSGNAYQGARDLLRRLRSFDFKILLRISLGSNPGSVTASQYAQHTRNLVQAAKDEGLTPEEVVFEYHNEYNGNDASAVHYVNMAKAAYPVIKSIDPNYKVIGGSENVYKSGWQAWLDRIYALGFGDVTDGLSWHDYAPQSAYSRTNDMYAILKKYGQQNKMIWMTETGASTRTSGGSDGGPNSGEGGVSYQGQATRITGLLRDLGKDWPQITHVILYVDLDRPNIGASNPHEAYFGLWENTSNWVRTPKPAVEAIKNLYRA
jgi:hypothetical protein